MQSNQELYGALIVIVNLWCSGPGLDLNVIKATMGGMLHLAPNHHTTLDIGEELSVGEPRQKAEYWTHKEFSIQFSWSETFYPTWKDLRLQHT